MDEMSDEELAEQIAALQRELTGRQTRQAISRDVTGVVDRIIADNPDIMGGEWDAGRVHVCADCVRVLRAPDEEDPAEETPEPIEEPTPAPMVWAPDVTLTAGQSVAHEGVVYRVVESHRTSLDRLPVDAPSLYAREE